MTDLRQQWFKVWAAEALLSDDLDDLTDHEERIWWRLVMVASLENERWTFQISEKTARKCHTKLPKLLAAVENFLGRGMLQGIGDGLVFVTNGPKWNEQTERKKKPSDSPERVGERVARHRNAQRNAALHVIGNAAHKEEEEEKEEEKEKDRDALPSAPRHKPITEAFLCELQDEFPTVNVRDVYQRCMNRKTWDGYKDKRRALRDHIGYALKDPGGHGNGRNGSTRTGGVQQRPDDPDPIEERLRLDAERESRLQLGVS